MEFDHKPFIFTQHIQYLGQFLHKAPLRVNQSLYLRQK
jgi:hypothetical protein